MSSSTISDSSLYGTPGEPGAAAPERATADVVHSDGNHVDPDLLDSSPIRLGTSSIMSPAGTSLEGTNLEITPESVTAAIASARAAVDEIISDAAKKGIRVNIDTSALNKDPRSMTGADLRNLHTQVAALPHAAEKEAASQEIGKEMAHTIGMIIEESLDEPVRQGGFRSPLMAAVMNEVRKVPLPDSLRSVNLVTLQDAATKGRMSGIGAMALASGADYFVTTNHGIGTLGQERAPLEQGAFLG